MLHQSKKEILHPNWFSPSSFERLFLFQIRGENHCLATTSNRISKRWLRNMINLGAGKKEKKKHAVIGHWEEFLRCRYFYKSTQKFRDWWENKFYLYFYLIGQHDRPFPQPGWIVLFCLLGFLFIVVFIVVLVHKRTRKQISGFCCRKYRALWPDMESPTTSNFMTAEDHYEEQVTSTESEWSIGNVLSFSSISAFFLFKLS